VQTIGFLAFLRERGTYGPFLILGPLSTIGNWHNEFKKWGAAARF
jgi:ATP-dependent DNA helicase